MLNAEETSPPAGLRAGSRIFPLLAGRLCVPVLRAHLGAPLRFPDLRERIGDASETALRGQIVKLRDLGALERHVSAGMPYTVRNELTDAGREILTVADLLEDWLAFAPSGPLKLGGKEAKAAIGALLGGWQSTILRELTGQSLSATALNGLILAISHPSVERRLLAMRAAGQIRVQTGGSGSKPYAITDWARRAARPLIAAGRCEMRHLEEGGQAMTAADIEMALLLALPLLNLAEDRGGACLLAVDRRRSESRTSAGVRLELEAGRVAHCGWESEQRRDVLIHGHADAWADAIVDARLDELRIVGGDPTLGTGVIEGLSSALTRSE